MKKDLNQKMLKMAYLD